MRQSIQSIGRAAVLGLAVVFAAGSALVADDAKKVDGDLKALQGTWLRDGDDGPDVKFVFEGDNLTATVDGMDYKTSVTVDSKATPHPTIDLTIKEGPGDSAGKKSKGIYKLDGKKLLFRVSVPGVDARPSDFKADDPDSHLFQLKKDEK
jgi:uncharacterized protein (TIGR03067 family)